MNAKDLQLKSDAELGSELEKSKRLLLNLRCRIAMGEEVRSSEVQMARCDIARILTIQRQREANSEPAEPAASE